MSNNNSSENNPQTKTPLPPADHVSTKYSSHKTHHINPPESTIPDSATLRDQWKYATRQYGKWYSHAWGTAILAGAAFFALGWFIKGENPIPSFNSSHDHDDKDKPTQPQ